MQFLLTIYAIDHTMTVFPKIAAAVSAQIAAKMA